MSQDDLKPDEPGGTAKRLREAETDEEFLNAYVAHKERLKIHSHALRPYEVLASRVIERFGQYGMGEQDNERREDALWLIREFGRYAGVLGMESSGGLNAACAVKRRTIAEIEADITHLALSVLGFERSRIAFGQAFPADAATPTSRQVAAVVDLGCTGEDDHEPAPCRKCEGIREQIGKVIDSALEEQQKLENQSRNAGVVFAFGGNTSKEDLEKMSIDGIKRGASAELELRRRKAERDEVMGNLGDFVTGDAVETDGESEDLEADDESDDEDEEPDDFAGLSDEDV
jgi:hypothetical protein